MHWNGRATQWNGPRDSPLQAGKMGQQQGRSGFRGEYARVTPVRWSSSKVTFEKEEDRAASAKTPEPPKEPSSAEVDTKAPVKRKWGLREFTMFASFLCAIDCTVFPVLLTVLPAAEMLTPENSAMIHHVSRLCPLHVCMCKQCFRMTSVYSLVSGNPPGSSGKSVCPPGFLNGRPVSSEKKNTYTQSSVCIFVCHLQASHLAALYVVLPIGTTTTITNFMLHRNLPLAALSTVGLSLILGSNADFSFLPAIFHESRILNTLGCGMLIGSSYLGHRTGEHDHDGKPKKSCHGPIEEPVASCHGKSCSKEPSKEEKK